MIHKIVSIVIILIDYLLIYTRADLSHVVVDKPIPTLMVYENISVGTPIVQDIRTYLNLPPKCLVRLGPGSINQFFRLDSQTGQLVCTRDVDVESETICLAEKSCCRLEEQDETILPSSLLHQAYHTPMSFNTRELTNFHQCRLMAFVLASTEPNGHLSPVTNIFIQIMDLNDNPPVFKSVNKQSSDQYPDDAEPIPAFQLSFLEGPGGLNRKIDLPLPYDNDFDIENRVEKYWLEWASLPKSLTSKSRKSEILLRRSQLVPAWIILGPFRLNYVPASRTISLELDSQLDREEEETHIIDLLAEDGGGLQGRLRISIDVLDVNEHAPKFIDSDTLNPSEPYMRIYTIKESLPIGTEIARLRAEDGDKTPGNVIRYKLGHGRPQTEISQTFQLDPKTGSISLIKPLDYERTKHYRLSVMAYDGIGGELDLNSQNSFHISRSSTGIIEITVLDVNDNVPVIRFEKYDSLTDDHGTELQPEMPLSQHIVHIREDISKGSSITYLSVSDLDSNANGQFSCHLSNWTEQFRLYEISGLYGVETQVTFDRESRDSYQLTIRCHDHGIPELFTQRSFLVQIQDVNDLSPKFLQPFYRFKVFENSAIGTPLEPSHNNEPDRIQAIDPDLNSTLVYRLEPRVNTKGVELFTEHNLFHIHPKDGLITTVGELDRELTNELSFQACVDDGMHTACTQVSVSLDDVNDNPPVFDRDTYVLHIEENQMSTSSLLTFKVTDADVDNLGFNFRFINPDEDEIIEFEKIDNESLIPVMTNRIIPGKINYHFGLRENTLYLRRPLDRELRSNYHFFVQATDNHKPNQQVASTSQIQLSSQAEIFIDVGDVNDNSPILIYPNSTGQMGNHLVVSCRETMGIPVGRLQAYDADLGLNASVKFSVIHTPQVDQLFHLDKHSGELFVNTGQLVDRCGQTVIMVIGVDDEGTLESKQKRNTAVERLIIQLKDRPTLAQLILAESKREATIEQSAGLNGEHFNSSLSTRAILGIILGGSTVFLICLLMGWLMLIIYYRSRCRKRNGPFQHGATRTHVYKDSTLPLTDIQSRSPSKFAELTHVWGTLDSAEHYNTFRHDSDYGKTSASTSTLVTNPTYLRCKFSDTLCGGQYSIRSPSTTTPTIYNSRRTSPTGTEQSGIHTEYLNAMWHRGPSDDECTMKPMEPSPKETIPVDCSLIKSSGRTHYLNNVSKPVRPSGTKSKSLPKWIRDTLGWHEKGSSMGPRLKQVLTTPSGDMRPIQENTDGICNGTIQPSTTEQFIRAPDPQIVYATIRRPRKFNQMSAAALNNQTLSNYCLIANCPSLTPALQRKSSIQDTEKCQYTPLLPNTDCDEEVFYAKPTSPTPSSSNLGLNYRPHICTSHSIGINCLQPSTSTESAILPPICVAGERTYPCCCPTCDPIPAKWTTELDPTGLSVAQMCPQCQWNDEMNGQFVRQSYCSNEYPKLLPTGRQSEIDSTPTTTQSPNHSASFHDILNSCV